jgi:hypothetical protein
MHVGVQENVYVSAEVVCALLCFAILHSCPTRSNMHVGVQENAYISFEGACALLCFAILHVCPTRANMHVGVLVFVAYALVQANQLGGSTPTYDVYDSDNYPLVSSTTQELPCECHHGPLAITQRTEHVLPKAQPLAITQCTEHVLPKAQLLALSWSIIFSGKLNAKGYQLQLRGFGSSPYS